jgi:hypothetical protein
VARTLDDLAALSGVSRSTVSRVINGGPASERARQQVTAALAQTGYRPNVAARTLASGRSGVVGVVIHLSPSLLFQDPYFGRLLQGIADALAERSLGMMLWLGNRSREENLDRILSMRLLDGAIVTANELDDPLVDGMLASSLPTVAPSPRRIASRATARRSSERDSTRGASSWTVTSMSPPGHGEPRLSWMPAWTRSSLPTTRVPWVRCARSMSADCGCRRRWRSRDSTTSTSPRERTPR